MYYTAVNQLIDLAVRSTALLAMAGIPHQIIGGFAVFLHVRAVSEDDARLTAGVDIAVSESEIAKARRLDGIDVLLGTGPPQPRRVLQLFPAEGPIKPEIIDGLCVAPVAELVHPRLSRNKLKDMMYVRDMLNVGLITAEMEAALPDALRERFDFIKAHE